MRSEPPSTAPRPALLGSGAAFVLASCAVVATAAFLGFSAIRQPVLGLPAGIWVIAAVSALRALVVKTRSARGFGTPRYRTCAAPPTPAPDVGRCPPGAEIVAPASSAGHGVPDRGTPVHLLTLPCARAARAVADRLGCGHAPAALVSVVDRIALPPAPLRVGVSLPSALLDALCNAQGTAPVQWFPVPCDEPDERACARLGLDALVRHDDLSHLYVLTAQRPGREAAWFDWAAPPPLSYASVFPLRLDPGQVSLGTVRSLGPEDARVVRAVVDAAALLSRVHPRLGLTDRLAGRVPLPVGPSLIDRTMADLAGRVALLPSLDSQLRRAAARAVSAWLVTSDQGEHCADRTSLIQAACAAIPGEPHLALRLVASLVADYRDQEALRIAQETLGRIDPESARPWQESWAFVCSELEHPGSAEATLGRIAAGICLVCATAPPDDCAILRDDLADDLRHTGWLVGREDDQRMLIDLMDALRRPTRTQRAA